MSLSLIATAKGKKLRCNGYFYIRTSPKLTAKGITYWYCEKRRQFDPVTQKKILLCSAYVHTKTVDGQLEIHKENEDHQCDTDFSSKIYADVEEKAREMASIMDDVPSKIILVLKTKFP